MITAAQFRDRITSLENTAYAEFEKRIDGAISGSIALGRSETTLSCSSASPEVIARAQAAYAAAGWAIELVHDGRDGDFLKLTVRG